MLSCARLAADGSAAYAFAAASTRVGSGENSASRAAKNRAFSLSSEFPVQIQRDLGERYARRLAALGQQFLAAGDEAPDLEPVARDDRCAFLNRFEHACERKSESNHARFKYRALPLRRIGAARHRVGRVIAALNRGPRVRIQACMAPPIPIGNAMTMTDDRGAEHGVPVFGDARERVGEPRERRRAEQRAGQRVETTEQHHDQRVDRARNCRASPARCCPWRTRRGRRPVPRSRRRARTRSIACRRTSMPIAAARSGESRQARSE